MVPQAWGDSFWRDELVGLEILIIQLLYFCISGFGPNLANWNVGMQIGEVVAGNSRSSKCGSPGEGKGVPCRHQLLPPGKAPSWPWSQAQLRAPDPGVVFTPSKDLLLFLRILCSSLHLHDWNPLLNAWMKWYLRLGKSHSYLSIGINISDKFPRFNLVTFTFFHCWLYVWREAEHDFAIHLLSTT